MKEQGIIDNSITEKYDEHQEKKKRSRVEKQKDKDRAKSDKNFQVVTFDLEAVLTTPCSLVNQAYYKWKLNCYNLSVYSLGDNKGTCYLWNETDGERGSCEISTCLYKYINSLPPYVKEVTLFSDNCMGQNRNKYVAAALLYSVSTGSFIDKIDQKFLEAGHTQMECDSMHSAIEYAKKNTSVCIPSQWDTIIRNARRKNPYLVVPLKHWDFIDFKQVQGEFYKNMEKNTEGDKVRWRDIVHLQFRKDAPDNIYYRYSYDGELLAIKARIRTRGKQRSVNSLNLPTKYTSRLSVSAAKKADLLSLCDSGVIPDDCRPFYETLNVDKAVIDYLPEPDEEDSEENDSD